MWQSRPLVVARHDEHRHTTVGNPSKRLECLVRHALGNARPIKDVAAMHDGVDFAGQGGLERGGVIR
jgi:hypothetical protein